MWIKSSDIVCGRSLWWKDTWACLWWILQKVVGGARIEIVCVCRLRMNWFKSLRHLGHWMAYPVGLEVLKTIRGISNQRDVIERVQNLWPITRKHQLICVDSSLIQRVEADIVQKLSVFCPTNPRPNWRRSREMPHLLGSLNPHTYFLCKHSILSKHI